MDYFHKFRIGLGAHFLIILLAAIFFYIISFLLNSFPYGSVVAGGDFYQIEELSKNVYRYFFAWTTQIGQGHFNTTVPSFSFYFILAIISFIFKGIHLSSLVFFLIIFLSFVSAYVSVIIVFKKIPVYIALLAGVLYSLNNFTFTIFSYPWGITHHFLFYIFIPIIFATLYLFLAESKFNLRKALVYLLVFIVSIPSFNNPSIFIVVLLAQFAFIFLYSLFNLHKIKIKQLSIKVLYILVIQFLVSFWFVIPSYLTLDIQLNQISKQKVLGGDNLSNWIIMTSNNFFNSFLLVLDENRFPVQMINFTTYSSLLIILLPFLLIFFVQKYQIKRSQRLIFFGLLALYVLFQFIVVRAYGPFKEINLLIYQLPGFVFFRSPEKVFSYLPFVYLLVVLYGYYITQKKVIIALLLGLVVIVQMFPFLTGEVAKALSHGNKYHYVVTIPNEYYKAAEFISRDERQMSVLSVPYSVVNSLNWANYSKWGYVGHDMLYLIFNKRYITANSYDHPFLETKISLKDDIDNNVSDDIFLSTLTKFNTGYVINHKDIDSKFISNYEKTKNYLTRLEIKGDVYKLEENDYFDLYKLSDKNLVPLLYADSELTFQYISPVEYLVQVNIKDSSKLVFNQDFNNQWKLYLEPINNNLFFCDRIVALYPIYGGRECNKSKQSLNISTISMFFKAPLGDETHIIEKDYANAWLLSKASITSQGQKFYRENRDGSVDVVLRLYYFPQSYITLGVGIVTLLLFTGIGGLIWSYKR